MTQKKNKEKEQQIQELVNQLDRMVDDRDNKCKRAKEQLIENLKITADKYTTATGVHEAYKIIKSLIPDNEFDIGDGLLSSSYCAVTMAQKTTALADKAKNTEYSDMDSLLDGEFDPDFAWEETLSIRSLTLELMVLDLCRNVGPVCDDLVSFINRTDEELAEITNKLFELDEDWYKNYEPIKEEE